VVELPDDDVEAFTVLCRVVHYRMSDVPLRLSAACLTKLAIICDKYGCVGAITHSSILWLQEALKGATADDLPKLLFAAYVLDVPGPFSSVSWVFILSHVGSLLGQPAFPEPTLVAPDLHGNF
jgi:hypothetical protein